jgi:hypothetical protein
MGANDAGPSDSGNADAGLVGADAGPTPPDSGPPDAGPADAGAAMDSGDGDGGADGGFFGSIIDCPPDDMRSNLMSEGTIVVENFAGNSVSGTFVLSSPGVDFVPQSFSLGTASFNLDAGGTFTYEIVNPALSNSELGVEINDGSGVVTACVSVIRVDPANPNTHFLEGADWGTDGHWRSNAKPATTDTVFISAKDTSAHVLDENAQVARLYVETGATLTLQSGAVMSPLLQTTDLLVGGRLDNASGAVSPNGAVQGYIENIICNNTMEIVGPVTAQVLNNGSPSCSMVFPGAARLRIKGPVTWNMAGLEMTHVKGILEVNDSLTFTGATGTYDQGTIEVYGSLAITFSGGPPTAGLVTRILSETTATVAAAELGTLELPRPSDPSQAVSFTTTQLYGPLSAGRSVNASNCLAGSHATLEEGFSNESAVEIRLSFDTCEEPNPDGGLCDSIGLPPESKCVAN